MSDDASAGRASAWNYLAWAGALTAVGLLNAYHFYLNGQANGEPARLLPRLIEELGAAWCAGLLLLFLTRAFPVLRRQPPLPRYLAHAVLLLMFSVLHTSLNWASRSLLFPLFGLGRFDYGVMPVRYLMEFPSDVIVYVLAASANWLLAHYRAGRARELHAAQLESALADARLESLRLQLNPHFLFNALNAVSSTMYDNPRAADEMLARIADLLRGTLRADMQEHLLGDELRLAALYLDIQRARFGERLQTTLHVDEGLLQRRVPFLVLQPLLENAIEHTEGSLDRQVSVRIRARGERLELCVRNRHEGTPSPHRGHGIGLRNTRERLQALYGDDAGLALEPTDAGTQARLWLPLREALAA